jgi:hypothetical protein
VAHVRYTLGDIAAAQGDDSRAAQLYEQSLATLRELGDRRCVASTLSNLGAVAVRAGRADRAAQLLDESLFIRRQVGDQAGVAECAERLADLRLLEGDPAGAARLAGSAGALRERSGAGRPAAGEAANRDRLRALRATLEVDVLGRAWQAGRAGADTFLHGGATS